MKKKEKETNATTERMKQKPIIYWMTVVTLIIIVIAFVVFPAIDGIFSPKMGSEVIGRYESTDVPGGQYSLYASNMNNMMYNVQSQYPPEQVEMYLSYFQSQIINQTIFTYGIVEELEKAGIGITSNKINRILKSQCGDPGLYAYYIIDPNQPINEANFSVKKYELAKAKNNLQVKGVRKNIALKAIVEDFQRDMDALSTISDAEKAFYTKMAQETVSGSYFKVTNEMISDELLATYVKENLSDFTKLDLSIIRTEDKQTAKDILLELTEDSELFTERATTYNSPALKEKEGKIDGFLGEIALQLNLTDEEVKDQLALLVADETTDIIEIDYYFYIIKANTEPTVAVAQEVVVSNQAAVISAIQADDSTLLDAFIEETAIALVEEAKADGFNSTAIGNGGTIEEMGEFSLNYNNASIIPSIEPAQFASNKTFLTEVFSAEVGDILNPVTSDADILVFKVTDKRTNSERASTGNEDQMNNALISNYIFDESRTQIYAPQNQGF